MNQREVRTLASGIALREEVQFPGNTQMTYTLQAAAVGSPQATFDGRTISVLAPGKLVHDWADGEEIGLYFDLAGEKSTLAVAIEKDFECTDGPLAERDPDAFPRLPDKVC